MGSKFPFCNWKDTSLSTWRELISIKPAWPKPAWCVDKFCLYPNRCLHISRSSSLCETTRNHKRSYFCKSGVFVLTLVLSLYHYACTECHVPPGIYLAKLSNVFLFNCESERIDHDDFRDSNFEDDRQPKWQDWRPKRLYYHFQLLIFLQSSGDSFFELGVVENPRFALGS